MSYAIKLTFEAGFFASSSELSIPIIIGTVPLMESGKSVPKNIPVTYQESIFDPTTTQEIPNEYDIKGVIVQTDADMFRPYYPYYKNLSSK